MGIDRVPLPLPLTTAGDQIIADADGLTVRLPVGSAGDDYAVIAGLPSWNGPELVRLSRYGITPDTGDDLTTVIQAVIDANPGKRILFDRPGIYLVNTVTQNTLRWCLSVITDDTSLEGVPGATLRTTQNAAVVFFAGPAKSGGFSSWSTTRFYPTLSSHALTGTQTKGGSSVTLATVGDAANYAVGDLVLIRTGQCIDTGTDQPDGEINEVIAVDVGTGVITVRDPLKATYQQEYFVTGTAGLTSTSVTANPAVYGISNVTEHTLRNVGIRGLRIEAPNCTTIACWQAYQIVGFFIVDCWIETSISNGNAYFIRNVIWDNNDVYLSNTTAARWFWTPGATCQTDVILTRNRCTAKGIGYVHLHEGAGRIKVEGNIFRSMGLAIDANTCSIRARGYDIQVLNNHFYGGGTANAIFADYSVTGGVTFDGNVVDAASTNAVSFSAANQRFGPNNRIVRGHVALRHASGTPVVDGHAPVSPQIISQWIADNAQNQIIGIMPAYSYLLRAHVQVTEAFNSDGTDLLEVGYDADPDAVITSVDVSTTGIKAVTLGVLAGYNGTERTIEAYYTNGGSEPTTGRALILLEYTRCAREVT